MAYSMIVMSSNVCADHQPSITQLVTINGAEFLTRAGEVKKRVALIGKGLTFDSGGYNLKVGGMIELMKFDMGGAGAVFGAAQIIADLKPEGVEVCGLRFDEISLSMQFAVCGYADFPMSPSMGCLWVVSLCLASLCVVALGLAYL